MAHACFEGLIASLDNKENFVDKHTVDKQLSVINNVQGKTIKPDTTLLVGSNRGIHC